MSMQKLSPLWLCLAIVLSIYIWHPPSAVTAQSQSTTGITSKVSGSGNDEVTVGATANIKVSNATLTAKDKNLRNAIIGFLNSGPNLLKTIPSDQPIVKTKVTNQLSNTTQSVEGIEATGAIIAVEVTKALKSLISSKGPNQTAFVNVETSSTCKPSSADMISCQNSVTLK